jgi:hypothetical protein
MSPFVPVHISADPLITPPARSNSAILPAARAPTHATGGVDGGRPRDQRIVESLVIPFGMIALPYCYTSQPTG